MAKKGNYSEDDTGDMSHYDPYLGMGKSGYAKARNTPTQITTSDYNAQIKSAKKNPAQGNSNSTAMNSAAKAGFNYGNR